MAFDPKNLILAGTKKDVPGLKFLGTILALLGAVMVLGVSLAWTGILGQTFFSAITAGLYQNTWGIPVFIAGFLVIILGILVGTGKYIGYYTLYVSAGITFFLGIVGFFYTLIVSATLNWYSFVGMLVGGALTYYLYSIHRVVNPEACTVDFIKNFCK